MSLSPTLQTRLVQDGFRIPILAGTTFTAGDIVVLGSSASAGTNGACSGLVCQAANDYNWQGSTSTPNSGNAVGVILAPKLASENIPAGAKLAWSTTQASTGSNARVGIATAVAGTTTTPLVEYPLGLAVAASTGAALTTDDGSAAVQVLLWPGSGLGS